MESDYLNQTSMRSAKLQPGWLTSSINEGDKLHNQRKFELKHKTLWDGEKYGRIRVNYQCII